MLNAIRVIVRARFLIARNTLWRGSWGRKIGIVVLLVVLGFGAWLLYRAMFGAVELLRSPDFIGALEQANREQPNLHIPIDFTVFLDALPSAVLFAALVIFVLSSFSTLLVALYLSDDMDMLLVAPVPMRAVFLVKFFGALLVPYLALFGLLGPGLVGYGRGMGFGFAYYVGTVGVLALLPLFPAGLGTLLVMLVVRVIPPHRAREIVGVLGGLVGVAWYIFTQFSRQFAPRVASVGTLDLLRRLDQPLLPSAWAARALLAAGRGAWTTLLLYGGLFAALSLLVFAGCLLLAERLYYVGWSNMSTQVGNTRRNPASEKPRRARASFLARLSSLVLPPQSAAVLLKDLRLFGRDLRSLQQLLFPLVLAGIWTFQLFNGRSSVAFDSVGQTMRSFGSAGISFYICLSFSNALAGTGISREGRTFWLLRTAPISVWQIFLGKWVLAFLPFPTIGALFVTFLALLQGSTALEWLRALVLVLLVGSGTTSISLGLGAAFPRFNWLNPNQQRSFRAGVLTMLAYIGYLALALALVAGLPFLAAMLPEWSTLLIISGWLLLAVLTLGAAWSALAFGAARLARAEVT